MKSKRYESAMRFLDEKNEGHRVCVGGPLNGLTVVDGSSPIGYVLEPGEDYQFRWVHSVVVDGGVDVGVTLDPSVVAGDDPATEPSDLTASEQDEDSEEDGVVEAHV